MKPKKTSMDTIKSPGLKGLGKYGDNARVKGTSLPGGGGPAGSKGKPR